MKPNKSDQFFAETILRHYQERTGETNEAIKIFTEVFRKSVANTMLQFKQSYRDIFAELPRKSFEEFYRTIFSSVNRVAIADRVLPPCLLKDFFDGSLDDVRSGGRVSEILHNLVRLETEEKYEEADQLAKELSIPEDGVGYLSEFAISYVANKNLKCSSIPDTPIDFDKRIFTELLRENLPELVFYLETKLGFRPPLRDITNEEKAALGLKWADKVKTVRFAEGEALEDVRLFDTSGEVVVKEASNVAQNVVIHGEGKIVEPNVRK